MISLGYGCDQRTNFSLPEGAQVIRHVPPPAVDDLPNAIEVALNSPLEFPPLSRAVLDDDHVVLAVDPETPHLEDLIAALWRSLVRSDVRAGNVKILVAGESGVDSDPRAQLPDEIREQVRVIRHLPSDDCCYLANSAGGERIYLSRHLTDAEVAVSVGQLEFDAVLGYAGTNSVFYPGLSNDEAVEKTRGQGHMELSPSEDRPLRQLVDEVGYLLGNQFSLQVIPAGGGRIASVLAGHADAVFREGRKLLDESWLVSIPQRVDCVVATIQSPRTSWEQVGRALRAARNLVMQGGRIILLTELADLPGDGVRVLQSSYEPKDAFAALREAQPKDLLPATAIAQAVDWAQVHLLSRLEYELVEELFMIPMESLDELPRILAKEETIVILESAHHVWGTVD